MKDFDSDSNSAYNTDHFKNQGKAQPNQVAKKKRPSSSHKNILRADFRQVDDILFLQGGTSSKMKNSGVLGFLASSKSKNTSQILKKKYFKMFKRYWKLKTKVRAFLSEEISQLNAEFFQLQRQKSDAEKRFVKMKLFQEWKRFAEQNMVTRVMKREVRIACVLKNKSCQLLKKVIHCWRQIMKRKKILFKLVRKQGVRQKRTGFNLWMRTLKCGKLMKTMQMSLQQFQKPPKSNSKAFDSSSNSVFDKSTKSNLNILVSANEQTRTSSNNSREGSLKKSKLTKVASNMLQAQVQKEFVANQIKKTRSQNSLSLKGKENQGPLKLKLKNVKKDQVFDRQLLGKIKRIQSMDKETSNERKKVPIEQKQIISSQRSQQDQSSNRFSISGISRPSENNQEDIRRYMEKMQNEATTISQNKSSSGFYASNCETILIQTFEYSDEKHKKNFDDNKVEKMVIKKNFKVKQSRNQWQEKENAPEEQKKVQNLANYVLTPSFPTDQKKQKPRIMSSQQSKENNIIEAINGIQITGFNNKVDGLSSSKLAYPDLDSSSSFI